MLRICILTLAVFVSSLSAQTNRGAGVYRSLQDMAVALWKPPAAIVSGLPTASTNTDRVYLVTDSAAAGDCTTGAGTARTFCVSNGSAWVALGGASSSGDVVGPASSIDSEIALFNSTTGKLLKSATGTGFVKVSSGVYQTPAALAEADLPTRTMRTSVLNGSTLPGTSGNVFSEPYAVKATNDFWNHAVWVYNDTSTDIYLYGRFQVPSNFISGAQMCATWTSTATTGNVRWQIDYRSTGSTGGLDQATSEEQVEANTAAPAAANNRVTSCMTLTDANIAAGDTFQFRNGREGSDTANDTMAAAAIVFDWYFEYQGR